MPVIAVGSAWGVASMGANSSATLAGVGAGLHPIHVAVSIALAASMSMALPVSTPPNAMAFATGQFTTRDMIPVSLAISGLGILAIIAGGGIVMRFRGMLE